MLKLIFFLFGFAIFLFGLFCLKNGLGLLNNVYLKDVIYALTKNPLFGCLFGTIFTILVQSSTAVTVMTISMVDSGLMSFTEALGIILGTNIGTTMTGQLMAFELEFWALPLIGAGLLIIIFTSNKKKYLGLSILGLGLIFQGMDIMGQAFNFVKTNPLFFQLLKLTNKSNLLALLFGIIGTAIIQSSSALTGIVLVLAKNGELSLLSATAIVLGSNIGTCLTAVIASIGSTTGGKRVALAHVILNVFGVLIIFPFLKPFTNIMLLSSTNLARQIANTSTIFNLLSSLVVLPFVKSFANLIVWLQPNQLK